MRRAPAKRDSNGRFVSGGAGGQGRPPLDPTLKALATADRERNFDFIRGLRDNAKADMELRFEAAKLLAQYSDGKPVTLAGPAVQVNVGTEGTGAPLQPPKFAFSMPKGALGTEFDPPPVEVSGAPDAEASDDESYAASPAIPAPIASPAPELPRLQIESPEGRQEPVPARVVRVANPEDLLDPDVVAAADRYETNVRAQRAQAKPPPAVAELVLERRRREAQPVNATCSSALEVARLCAARRR